MSPPKLHHYGLITGRLDKMVDWYGKVLGMKINHQATIPLIARLAHRGPPFRGFSFLSNDEMDHRIVLFEIPKASPDPDRLHHTGMQHVAFECAHLDDWVGTYLRLKGLGIAPAWAADHGVGISMYYEDPDLNVLEINVSNYGSPQASTEFLRSAPPGAPAQVDPAKLAAARAAGASAWAVHERAMAGEFAPDTPYDPARHF